MAESGAAAGRPVAVIGGGITGLSAAYELVRQGRLVTLFEQSPTLGGKIAETVLDGTVIPTGPDAFLARRPEVSELAMELGLGSDLVSPVARAARIYRNGELHALPPNVLGVPATTDFGSSGLISQEGAAIAASGVADSLDRVGVDESVGSLVRRQLGDEVLEFLVDPLLGGINAGDSDRLSVMAGVPQLDALRKKERRLIDAAAATIAEARSGPSRSDKSGNEARSASDSAAPPPVFHSIDGGLGRLVERLVEELATSGLATIFTGTTADLAPAGPRWRVGDVEVDHVISTIPAPGCARLIEGVSADAATILSGIEYSSVALTVMVLAPDAIELDPAISGVLVPRSLGHHVTAVSFASHKWPELAVGGRQVLRVSVGRRTNTSWVDLTNDELVDAIERDLSEIFGKPVRSTTSSVHRWMDALPQYDVGHLDRMDRLDQVPGLDGITLTGAWRNGLGLPACIGSGRAAVRKIVDAAT